MDRLSIDEEFDREVRQTMREQGVDREEAFLIVALRRGERYGAGDLVSVRPLSTEERRAIGLDHDPEQIIANDLAELAKEPSDDATDSAKGVATRATASAIRRS